jgi:uncharacterized protein YggE
MTTSDVHTLISVRGEGRRIVPADQATIFLTVVATGDTKRASSSDVARALAAVTAQLAELGGESLTALTTRAPLTWSTQSIQTTEEHSFDKSSGAHAPTGRHRASAGLLVNVRDFGLLGQVQAVVTERDMLNVDSVQWSVDEDNPAWAHVRADAIRAALHKGQDYASALGGSVVSVEHIADAGLLGGDAWGRMARPADKALSVSLGGVSDTASLDPVPQVLGATIEARLMATVGPLPTRG